MGLCNQIHDNVPTMWHFSNSKYILNRVEKAILKDKEKLVNGIPIDILSRANLFANDSSIAA